MKPGYDATRQSHIADQRPLVVHVVRQFAPSRGGLEDVVANLCRSLPEQGYRVRVVTLDRIFTDPDTKLPARETVEGIEVVRIPWSGSSRYPLAPTVFRHIQDADLLHVHAIDFFFDALAWTRPFHGKPMVATTHGGFFHTPRFAAVKKVWFRTLTRLSAGGYRALVCCSASDMALFSQIAADRVTLIENGADITKFANDAVGPPPKRIATLGRFSVNKRLDRLIAAFAALVRRDGDWRLDVIGTSSDLGPEDLRRLLDVHNVAGSVRLHLSPDDETIRALFSQASLFASASEYEGFGLVAVEVMAAGLVPVLNANDAYKALARRHDGVVLADFADAAAAAERMEAAYRALAEEPEAVRAAMKAAASAYDWHTVSGRYAEVYAAILRG